ncbi:MAG: dTDP-4-dehydrorhamnose reductase [Planctomycetota bacterium]|jgi:dTDP-4-dehydrorhamnose reductase
MDKSRIAILGGRGMLGTDVVELFQQNGLNVSIYDLPEFDITNPELIRKALEKNNVVVNCAAYTNVEEAERETDLAFQINSQAVKNLGQIAKDLGIWVLQLSTDFIFDGKSANAYSEKDTPNPINAYGKSKLKGEQLLMETNCQHCILRIEWTYGHHGNNFVKKILTVAQTTQHLRVIDDQIGSPTATSEVAEVIFSLVQKKSHGIFHFAADGYVSRYDYAKFFLEKMNLPVNITPCKTADFETLAVRPLNSRFNCSKIKKLLNVNIKPWQKPLEHFLRQI